MLCADRPSPNWIGVEAAQHFIDDIASLKMKAIRGDESLNKLANQRLRTFLLVTMLGNADTAPQLNAEK